MTRKEQTEFIADLIKNVQADLLKQLPLTPETWDGHELRQWIADMFQDASWTIKEKHNRARYRAYKNTLLTMGRR